MPKTFKNPCYIKEFHKSFAKMWGSVHCIKTEGAKDYGLNQPAILNENNCVSES